MLIEARWADGRISRLPALMTEVIERKVDVLVTWSTAAAFAPSARIRCEVFVVAAALAQQKTRVRRR